MVLPRWRGLNSSKFCKNSVDFSAVTDIIKAMHYLSCLKSLPGSYFFSLSPATATNFDSCSVVFSNIRKVVTVAPTMSRKFDGLEVGCIVFLRQIHFRVPLLLLLPLLAIAFHWNLKKKLVHWFCLLQCTVLPNFPPVQEHSQKTRITDLGNRVFPPNSTPSRRGFRAKFSLRSFYFSLFSQTEFSSICLTSVKQRLVCTLHVAVCLFISNTERWPQNVVGTKKMPSVPLMFLPYFDDFCDLLGRNRQMATWNMFFFYISSKMKSKMSLMGTSFMRLFSNRS